MVTRRQLLMVGAATMTRLVTRVGESGAAQLTPAGPLAAAQPRTDVTFTVPGGACDTHTHMFGDPQRYPYAPTTRYRHGPSTPEDLQAMLSALRVDRVVLVQPSAYGTDNSCMLDGVGKIGSAARAVVAIDEETTDRKLDEMDRRGARGIRIGLGASAEDARNALQAAENRLKGRGWHVCCAPRLLMLAEIEDQLMAMSVPVLLDHWVRASAAGGVSQPNFEVILRLLRGGHVYVKLSHQVNALGVSTPDFPSEATALAKAMIEANPLRILWATDWPHAGGTGQGPGTVSPYHQFDDGLLFNHVPAWMPDARQRQTILVENPARLYGF